MQEPMISTRAVRWSNYVIALLITVVVFGAAVYASTYFNNLRIGDIRAMQDDISTDILSIETQFDLLQERSCNDIAENTILPSELSALGNQLSYMESQRSAKQDEIVRLKRLYSLLEIKDYLLMKQLAARCRLKPVFVLYFYSNEGDCPDCEKQGYALTALSKDYPQLRIYSFDRNLDVSALHTFAAINDVEHATLPALVTGGTLYAGYRSVEDIQKILPQLSALKKSAPRE